ncbi:neuropeptide Y receptor type 4-2-like [Spea bombifrons]|uniref:neuropeptide Y receptor type 4-2-like n=1 Tax=Spea bombifrons TaxID=233779 RepID=UPI00234AE92C|nr:neuropeptide Y receptor type 4-2-like [Spea bombifrons]
MNETVFQEKTGMALLYQNASQAFLVGFHNKCIYTPDITPFLGASYSLATVLGLLGNVSLICVICQQKKKANVTHILIANLAFSDMLVCTFCLPITAVYTMMDYWVFGQGLCKISNFVQCASVTVSALILVLIAFERHQLILYPTGWRPTIPQAYAAVLLVWVLASLLTVPFVSFVVLTNVSHKNTSQFPDFLANKPLCMEKWKSAHQKVAYTISLQLLQYIMPLCFILCCYLRISVHLRSRGALFKKNDSHMRRVNLMLAAMVGAFAACWLPLHIFNTIVDWHHKLISVCFHNLIFSLCHLLAMTSTCVNPVIYGVLNSNINQELNVLFQKCTGRHGKRAVTLEEQNNSPLSLIQSAALLVSPVSCHEQAVC